MNIDEHYGAMKSEELEEGDLARWEIWEACRRSGQSMRSLSISAGINEAGVAQILARSQFVPQPATLRALAGIDILGLSYMRMMLLFGHIDPPGPTDQLDHLLAPLKRRLADVPEADRARIVRQLLGTLDVLAVT